MKSKMYKHLLLLLGLIIISDSTILITSPAINPFDQSKIPYSFANIGNIPYGKTLSFDLKQGSDIGLCESMQKIAHYTDPTYLLVDASKGTCSYTTQAINAQQLGAKGIVFVSDMVNYYGKVVQVDDGNGRKIHISVLFISTQTYRSLQTVKNIHIKVLFQVYKTQKVNLTYFLSSSGRSNYIFLREFQPYYQKIKDYINFKPLYITFNCPFCSDKDCLVSNNYCMFELDSYKDDAGELILKEQLRQWNIWKKQGTDMYFKYMNQFDKYCSVNWIASESCGDGIIDTIKASKTNLQQSPTSLMDEWKAQQIAAGFLSTPELTINQQLYAGTYDPQQVFDAICSSLLIVPAECLPVQPTKSSKLGWIIAVIVIACVISMLIGYFVYRKCVKKQLTKDMFSKVNQLVARYATKVSDHNKKRKQRLKMRLTEEL